MPEIHWKTSDGNIFLTEEDARRYQNNLDKSKAVISEAKDLVNQKSYSSAIRKYELAYFKTESNFDKGNILYQISLLYLADGQKDKAIEELKRAIRLHGNLDSKVKLSEIDTQTNSSSKRGGYTAFENSGFAQFLENIGFENACFGLGLNTFVSILLGLVLTVGVSLLGMHLLPSFPLWVSAIVFIIAFASFRFTHKVLIIILSIIATIGIAIGVYGFVSSSTNNTPTSIEQSMEE